MNGILVIDKPAGFTSHDVVNKVRRILRTKSVGHTGTLDPFATGVLVILVGKATRLAQFLDKSEKEYLATVRFGFATDTGDLTGEMTYAGTGVPPMNLDELEAVLAKFRGEIQQKPPMYSAKKIEGKKLYELARKGIEIERKAVPVKISELEAVFDQNADLSKFQNGNFYRYGEGSFELDIKVVCSAGTYIRVLAEDLGTEFKVGGHLSALRRTRAGFFEIRQAVTLDELEKLAAENEVEKVLVSPADALEHLSLLTLNKEQVQRIVNGMKVRAENLKDNEFVRMCDEAKNLIAVGIFNEQEQSVQPRVVLVSADNG
jgi:tRNA pseudouridine55 synthase